MTTSKPDSLFGLPGAEVMYSDIEEVYNNEIEPWSNPGDRTFEVEEWSVTDNKEHMPSVDMVADYIYESVADADVNEGWVENAEVPSRDVEFKAALQAALDLFASKIGFYMADKKIGTWHVHVGEDGEVSYERQEV